VLEGDRKKAVTWSLPPEITIWFPHVHQAPMGHTWLLIFSTFTL